jgi:hypothetical protein
MELEEIEALLLAHETAEIQNDLEGTVATLADNPQYELPTVGWKLEGLEAVREFYKRTLGPMNERAVSARKRVHGIAPNTLCREAHLTLVLDGEEVVCNYSAVIVLDGDRIAGERLYTDPFLAGIFADALGDDFGDVPGVSRLPWAQYADRKQAEVS